MSRTSSAIETDLTASSGFIDITSEAVSTVIHTPLIFGLFLITGLSGLLSQTFSNFFSLVAGALGIIMAFHTLGGDVESQRSFLIRVFFVLIAGIVAGILIVIGALFLVIPGIYLSVRFQLVTATIMLEDCGPIEALQRSFSLTKGHAWTIFGVTVLIGIASILLGAVGAVLVVGVPSGSANFSTYQEFLRIGGAVSTIVVSPVSVGASAVMYGLYSRE